MRFLLASTLALSSSAIGASTSLPFTWAPLQSGSQFAQCEEISFEVDDGSSSGFDHLSSSFSLLAIPQDGIPSLVGNLGRDGRVVGADVPWTLPYAPGTQLVMGLTDSLLGFGGWSAINTVASGAVSTVAPGCLVGLQNTTDVVVDLNVTSIDACDHLGIAISGGTPPYNLTILPFNPQAQYSINSTMQDSIVASARPVSVTLTSSKTETVMISVRDSTGAFAASPPLVTVTGGKATCSSLPSTPSTSPTTGSATSGATGGSSSAQSKHSNVGAIAGGAVGGGVVAVFLLAMLWYRFRRPRTVIEIADDEEKNAPAEPPFSFITPFPTETARYPLFTDSARVTPATLAPPLPRKDVLLLRDSDIATPASSSSWASSPRSWSVGLRVTNPDHESEAGLLSPDRLSPCGASSSTSPTGMGSSSQCEIVQHEDAGEASPQDPERFVLPTELPPTYNSVGMRRRTS